MLTNVIKNSK